MDGLIAYVLSKKHTDSAIQEILDAGFKVQVEQDRSILSRTGQQMTLYLIPKESSLSTDTYDEYVYTNKWEQIGSTDIDLNYEDLENKPKIHGITIEGNHGHETYNLFGMSRASGWMVNFTDLGDKAEKNGIFTAIVNQVESLPEFMDPKDKRFIIFDYQSTDQGILDVVAWMDAATNKPKMAFRAGNNNIYTVSDWVELTGGGSQIVSGVVDVNGHITFTDSDGNTFTTTGASVIGPQGVPGQDYVLTAQDKTDIANIVLGELPTTQGVLYGNTSN